MDYYQKKINISEINAIELLSELKLDKLLYPKYLIKENTLYIEKCNQLWNSKPDNILSVVKCCVDTIYKITVQSYSAGIYSFLIGKDHYNDKQNYFKNLATQLNGIISNGNEVINNKHEKLFIRLKEYSKNYNKLRFTILHGDLHPGNIVYKDSKILLIDWEYLRFGPPELEISYYIILCALNSQYKSNDINLILNNLNEMASEWEIDFNIITEIFLPYLIICLSIYNKMNRIRNSIFQEEYLSYMLNIFI